MNDYLYDASLYIFSGDVDLISAYVVLLSYDKHVSVQWYE